MERGAASPRKEGHGGRSLGRYELIAELASGGMGTVYLARHAGQRGFQRLFAAKVLHPHLSAESEFVDMLHDEALLAARIHHPNVVAVVDIGSEDARHYVVMEYVEGPAFAILYGRSAKNRPVGVVLSILIDALEGLHAAHTLTDDYGEPVGLVHRDVSPQNVLVSADGIARITDFGIAKARSRITSTQPGTRKGKLQFMAPEQVMGWEVDRRADIWAAGVMLWTTLTGQNLFKADTDAATLHNLLSSTVPVPSSQGTKPPECLDAIILRALERDQEKRFSSALEMADALRTAAAKNDLLATRHEVASWVSELFGNDLERRRQAIRQAQQATYDESSHVSRVVALPVLPPLAPTPTPAPFAGVPEGATAPSLRKAEAGVSLPPEALSQRHVMELSAPAGNARPLRRHALKIAVACALAGGIAWASQAKLAPEPRAEQQSAPAAPRQPIEPAVTAAAPPTAPPETAIPDSEPTAAEPRASVADEKRAPRLYRRARPRAVTAVTSTPASAASPSPVVAPPPKAAKSGDDGFETNPYFRR
ncbi:MAG TPA: serine/threonine-protein kinase [Polyangiaceae bacterium]